MYGRLVEIEGLDASRRDEMMATIREQVIPSMKETGGFEGFISLVDEQMGRARNVVLWDTRESAEEFERQWASRREEIVRGFGGTIRSADLYEAPLVEVKAGAHAQMMRAPTQGPARRVEVLRQLSVARPDAREAEDRLRDRPTQELRASLNGLAYAGVRARAL